MDKVRAELVAGLRASRKYRDVCDATLDRIARWSLERYPQPKLALKMAKRKLHQIYGAYVEKLQATGLEERLGSVEDATALEGLCGEVLSSHASTNERLPFMEKLYPSLFETTGLPESILDLGCGLHPFALPWMGLRPGTRYIPIDIDLRLTLMHDALLRTLGMAPLARCEDLLSGGRSDTVDVAFLFKVLPCLDRQESDSSEAVLASLDASWIVVSFPTQSLGGRAKGMETHYAAQYEPLLDRHGRIAGVLSFPNEVFYVLARR